MNYNLPSQKGKEFSLKILERLLGLLKVSSKDFVGKCPICGGDHTKFLFNAISYTRSCKIAICPKNSIRFMYVSNPAKCLGCNDTVGCNGKKKTII